MRRAVAEAVNVQMTCRGRVNAGAASRCPPHAALSCSCLLPVAAAADPLLLLLLLPLLLPLPLALPPSLLPTA